MAFNRASYNKPNPNLVCGKNTTGDVPPQGERLKLVSTDGLRTVTYRPITEAMLRQIAAHQPDGQSPLSIACRLIKGDHFTIRMGQNDLQYTVYLD